MAITFKKPSNAAAAAPAKRGVRKSRYAGVAASKPRNGRLEHCADGRPAIYVLKILTTEEGGNPGKGTESYKINWEIVALDPDTVARGCAHEEGDVKFESFLISGNGGPSGLARVKAFVMAGAGYEDEAEYDAMDGGEGKFIDATVGEVNEHTNKENESGSPIEGRLIVVEVSRGNPTTDGDYYRQYTFAPYTEEA